MGLEGNQSIRAIPIGPNTQFRPLPSTTYHMSLTTCEVLLYLPCNTDVKTERLSTFEAFVKFSQRYKNLPQEELVIILTY